jgi:vacuolar-type H+-ATPase subunit F/Vma7
MSTQVRVVCRPAVAPGFALAGLQADPLGPTESLEALFAGFARRPEVGVVLLQEEIYDGLPEEVRGRLDRSAHPFVVPFPGPAWEALAPAEERVIELLRRAIGYRVRLR